MFLSEWREFPSVPCLAGKKSLMTARVSMLLKSRASLTCFRASFPPGRAKDLSAPRYIIETYIYVKIDGLINTVKFVHKRSADLIEFVFGSAELVRKMQSN